MRKILAPSSVHPTGGSYHHGLLISQPREFVRMAGQIGNRLDGTRPADFTAQAEQAWDNVEAILGEAGMTVADICKIVTYVVEGNMPAYMEVHKRRTQGHSPPWTAVPLPRMSGDLLVEIDVEAMR